MLVADRTTENSVLGILLLQQCTEHVLDRLRCFHYMMMLGLLTDRKKDLVKLQAGEYVSLGKVETSLKLCPLIDNLCLYADSSKMFTVCLVVPNCKNIEALAQRINISDDIHWPELCDHPAIEKEVLSQLQAHGLKCNSVFICL